MSRFDVYKSKPSTGARSAGWYAIDNRTGIGIFTTGQLAWAKALDFTEHQDRQEQQ
jgi:hypothetical protein